MGYINIFVNRDAHISVKNNQVFLKSSDKIADFPLEDMNAVMIENLNTTISTYTLSKFAEKGILVFICNQNHLPNGIVLPYLEYYQTLSQYENQVSLSKPLQKQLWQTIIKNKIYNQNEVLNICGGNNSLKDLYNSVLSGDSSNNEAKASLIYFKELFGKIFTRRSENPINAFLNYGYSILRGFIARNIAVSGLVPFLGLFHKNSYNNFNLADDLIEVFRPIVDLYVKIHLVDEIELTPKIKSEIFNIINFDIEIEGQKQTVGNAIEMIVESYAKSLRENQNCLKDVKICGLEMHKYE